jgi:hypothetical protein
MKSCIKCNQIKDLSKFYKHKQMADGHLNKCIDCVKKYIYERRHLSDAREKILEYDRARGSRQNKDYQKEFRERYPKKYKAHIMVNNAIRRKALFKMPCEICGEANTHGHHDDYDKPLNVRWLCSEHHQQWHAKNGEGKNSI